MKNIKRTLFMRATPQTTFFGTCPGENGSSVQVADKRVSFFNEELLLSILKAFPLGSGFRF